MAKIKFDELVVTINDEGKLEAEGDKAEHFKNIFQPLIDAWRPEFLVPSIANAIADYLVYNFKNRGINTEVLEYDKVSDDIIV